MTVKYWEISKPLWNHWINPISLEPWNTLFLPLSFVADSCSSFRAWLFREGLLDLHTKSVLDSTVDCSLMGLCILSMTSLIFFFFFNLFFSDYEALTGQGLCLSVYHHVPARAHLGVQYVISTQFCICCLILSLARCKESLDCAGDSRTSAWSPAALE